jgi:transcriptional regulator with XRE-family HTH domain
MKISSGIGYLDHLFGFLKTGDNVIWEVEAGTYVEVFLQRFVESSLKDGNKVVYVSFNVSPATLSKTFRSFDHLENLTILDCFTPGKGNNAPLFAQFYGQEEKRFPGKVLKVENPKDLAQFRTAMDQLEIEMGPGVRYVFDSLTGMQDVWGDENSTYKFFTYSCPRLYDLETIAYWVLEKDAHTPAFKANLRHITQVAIDLSKEDGELFFKVLMLKGRFSRSAFLPKRYEVWDQGILFPSIGGRRPSRLGEKLKALRKKLGITQKELALQVGLTPSFISQLEKNLISPSLDSLLKLSEKLNTQPIHLLMDREEEVQTKAILTPGERQEIHLRGMKTGVMKLQLLVSDTLNRRMEPYLLTLKKGAAIQGHFHHYKGDEFAYVMEGELEITLQGQKHRLRRGDSIYLESTVPTHWANTGKGEAVLLWALSPPRGNG